jgi:hypothetical protein
MDIPICPHALSFLFSHLILFSSLVGSSSFPMVIRYNLLLLSTSSTCDFQKKKLILVSKRSHGEVISKYADNMNSKAETDDLD